MRSTQRAGHCHWPAPPAPSTGLDTVREKKKPKQTNLEINSPLCFYCFYCQSCLLTNPFNLEKFRDQVSEEHRFWASVSFRSQGCNVFSPIRVTLWQKFPNWGRDDENQAGSIGPFTRNKTRFWCVFNSPHEKSSKSKLKFSFLEKNWKQNKTNGFPAFSSIVLREGGMSSFSFSQWPLLWILLSLDKERPKWMVDVHKELIKAYSVLWVRCIFIQHLWSLLNTSDVPDLALSAEYEWEATLARKRELKYKEISIISSAE